MGSLDKDIFWGGANLVPRAFPFFKGKALGTRFGWCKVGVLGLCLPPDEEVYFFCVFQANEGKREAGVGRREVPGTHNEERRK